MKKSNIDVSGLKIIEDTPTTKFHHTYLTDDGQTRTFRPDVYEIDYIPIMIEK